VTYEGNLGQRETGPKLLIGCGKVEILVHGCGKLEAGLDPGSRDRIKELTTEDTECTGEG